MPEEGHLRRLLPVVRGLHARGFTVPVWTDARFARQVTDAGGSFQDLFARWPLADADAHSRPVPARYVSFAGHYGADIINAARSLMPDLVLYDTFAVIGRVVAHALNLPHVNVCSGHNVAPQRFLAQLAEDPRVAIDPTCHHAVERLKNEFGMADASPFSYVNGLSPYLNLYCEPPAFLTAEERAVFEPVAFFGSLPSLDYVQARTPGRRRWFKGRGERKRIYASFGTVVWRYYEKEALVAFRAVADAVAARPDWEAVISFGGNRAADAHASSLVRPNVRVDTRVNQWAILEEADVFLTHHGLNSTHEAIFQRVPMLSYPFFWDQPGLAQKCQELGIAESLTDDLRGPVTSTLVGDAMNQLWAGLSAVKDVLERVRGYELAVMAARSEVLDRVARLASQGSRQRS
jgi:MGT family glycosyltransferase